MHANVYLFCELYFAFVVTRLCDWIGTGSTKLELNQFQLHNQPKNRYLDMLQIWFIIWCQNQNQFLIPALVLIPDCMPTNGFLNFVPMYLTIYF